MPSIAVRRMASWTSSDADIASLSAAHSRVDPSTSVKRNVTVPDGRVGTARSARSVMSTMVLRCGGAEFTAWLDSNAERVSDVAESGEAG